MKIWEYSNLFYICIVRGDEFENVTDRSHHYDGKNIEMLNVLAKITPSPIP